ncbi:MAG TPA: ATP-binding protein [Bacteroidota bacterium]|jgi:heavy metal sensor kinase|nr:ATP-binding protein [Bacteroidota bacterium]
MFFKSIRFRLAITYATILILSFIIFGMISYLSISSILLDNLDSSLSTEINWIKNNITPIEKKKRVKQRKTFIFTPQKPTKVKSRKLKKIDSTKLAIVDTVETIEPDETWNKIYEHLLWNSKNNFIFITDLNDEEIYRSANLKNDTLYFAGNIETDKINFLWSSNLRSKSMRLAATKTDKMKILVGYPFEEISDILNELFSVLILIIPISFVISIVTGWFLARKSLQPVDQITRTAREISSLNLSKRIPPNEIDDEIGRLITTFNEMIDRLQKSFEQTKQFSVSASHELRTPLTILRGEIEVALKSNKTPEEYVNTLKSLLDEVVRMSSIIDSLFNLTKSDAGQTDVHFEIINLDTLVMELYEDSEHLAKNKNISILLNKMDEVKIRGDKVKLRQLFLNLIDNAIKYNNEFGKVEISLYKENKTAIFVITDTGIGIPKESINKIFERFYRVDKARSRELGGSGLGLAIAKWIVDLHKGTIEVNSELGKGSTFIIKFPIVE